MNKMRIYCIIFFVILFAGIGIGISYELCNLERTFPKIEVVETDNSIGDLDHDITVYNVQEICDVQINGFDVTVGPTGWPFGNKVMWEVALYKDAEFYYARLIYHEYILWWTFDDPYIVCKIPINDDTRDIDTNEKHRWQVLWDITYTTLRFWDYSPYISNSEVYHINGHSVSFGNYRCVYDKYYVVSSRDYPW